MKMVITRFVLGFRNLRQWSVAQAVLVLLMVLKLFPADGAMNFADRVARFIGPRMRRHRLMLVNLQYAFPEKSDEERLAIALDAWGAMGRLAAEYVFLDQLFDFDPAKPGEGRVEVVGIPTFLELRDHPRPFIVFTAHTGNFELLPVASAAFGLDVTVLFRPPNNPYISEQVHRFRKARMGALVPSHAGSSFALASKLDQGRAVGMLVDQKFRKKGVQTEFFGHKVRTNPLLAKLVRQYDCDVFPARCVRLPGNRFRLEIEPAMTIPRNEKGDVDINATAQALNDKVESWVREYPGQWLWYHDRWNIKKSVMKA